MSASEPAPAPEPEAENIGVDVASALLAAVQDLTASVKETRAEQPTQGAALNTLSASLAQVVGAVATLNGSVATLQAAPAGAAAEKKEEDPRDLLPYVPYFDARDENPHPERPRGISDRPQLYQLTEATSPTYGYLRKKKNAAYHELATTACILSYSWDSNFYFKEKQLEPVKTLLLAEGSEHAKDLSFGLEAYANSISEQYALLNRRKNLVELRARIESDSPTFTPSEADRKLWESMSKSIGGWEANLGVDASIDPLFRRALETYHKDKHAAEIKALAKSGASGSTKPPKRTPKKNPAAAGEGSSG